jgi:hypothetical protein
VAAAAAQAHAPHQQLAALPLLAVALCSCSSAWRQLLLGLPSTCHARRTTGCCWLLRLLALLPTSAAAAAAASVGLGDDHHSRGCWGQGSILMGGAILVCWCVLRPQQQQCQGSRTQQKCSREHVSKATSSDTTERRTPLRYGILSHVAGATLTLIAAPALPSPLHVLQLNTHYVWQREAGCSAAAHCTTAPTHLDWAGPHMALCGFLAGCAATHNSSGANGTVSTVTKQRHE